MEAEDLYGLVEENKFIKQAGSSYRAIIELALSKLDNNPQDKTLISELINLQIREIIAKYERFCTSYPYVREWCFACVT